MPTSLTSRPYNVNSLVYQLTPAHAVHPNTMHPPLHVNTPSHTEIRDHIIHSQHIYFKHVLTENKLNYNIPLGIVAVV